MQIVLSNAPGEQFILSTVEVAPSTLGVEPERLQPLRFTSAAQAASMLSSLTANPAAMPAFRLLLAEARQFGTVGRMTDPTVLRHVAELVAVGLLRVLHIERLRSGGSPEEAKAAPAQSAAPPAAPSKPPPEEEPPTFAGPHDPSSQAKALQDAAKDGVPFCEECAKAAAARLAS